MIHLTEDRSAISSVRIRDICPIVYIAQRSAGNVYVVRYLVVFGLIWIAINQVNQVLHHSNVYDHLWCERYEAELFVRLSGDILRRS